MLRPPPRVQVRAGEEGQPGRSPSRLPTGPAHGLPRDRGHPACRRSQPRRQRRERWARSEESAAPALTQPRTTPARPGDPPRRPPRLAPEHAYLPWRRRRFPDRPPPRFRREPEGRLRRPRSGSRLRSGPNESDRIER